MKRFRIFPAALCLALLSASAARATETIRRFNVEITAADLGAGTVTFVHSPSGYTVSARITARTAIQRFRYFHPGEIPEGATLRIDGATIDEKNHTVTARECSEQPIADHDLVADPATQRICGRLFHEPGDAHIATLDMPQGDWTTPDRRTALGIQTADGHRWRLHWELVTPLAHRIEPGVPPDLQVGRHGSICIADRGGNGYLISADIEVWFDGAESRAAIGRCPPDGPSGITPPQMKAQMDAVRQKYSGIEDALARCMPVTMDVNPRLLLVGEPVELDFRVLSAKQPNSKAILFADYFHTQLGSSREINLPWKLTGTAAGLPLYTASVPLPAAKVGQYLVQWNCDVGGDIQQFNRTYAVCDNHSAVCLFLICGGETNGPKADLHKQFIPFDYWTSVLNILPALANEGPDNWANQSRESRQFGDNPQFLATPGTSIEPPDIQRLDVDAVKELAPLLGYPNRPVTVWSYTFGNAAYREMQSLGGISAGSLCTENHIDGGMQINCWGKPERPYFMSPEDFRKAGPGGPGRLVAFSQLQRHTKLARNYLCDYCSEAACIGGNLFSTTGHAGIYDDLTYSRMFDGYNAFFQMARCQKSPYFIANSIEMNGNRPGATEGNRMVVEYAAKKAAAGNVVFADTCAVAQFYQRHYTSTPESTSYFDDYWAGTHVNDKPDLFPDTMTMESGSLYALALAGQILPDAAYDYTVKWDYPDFGNDTLPRRIHDPNSYLLPGKYDKFAATPHALDTRPFHVSRCDTLNSGSLVVTITVDARKDQNNLPLALWNLPREFEPGDDWYHASDKSRFVPIVAPYSGNLNGFLLANVTKGRNVFTLRISSPARTLQSMDFQIGASLRGKIFNRDGRQMAYIWPTGPWPATLHLHLPAGSCAKAYVAPQGALLECPSGDTTVKIPQDQWMRLVGLDRDQIVQFATAEHQ
jgi:hypothetical protein